MRDLVILLNFNSYQGGGETLLIRFAEYLRVRKTDFLIFCSLDGFIYSELKRREFSHTSFIGIGLDSNILYLNENDKNAFLDILLNKIGYKTKARLVSFCMRDLYIAFLVSQKIQECTISHLVLHIQDDLFLGQTIADKVFINFFGKRKFSNYKFIKLNRLALATVNETSGLISMAKIINDFWYETFRLQIPDSHVIPLPSFRAIPGVDYQSVNNKRIIWIGRIVDFKIPAIIAMLEFLSNNEEYSLTIVGEGNRRVILNYIKIYGIDITRVKFEGEVSYQDLGKIIQGHSIGYGMGTSLIELAMYKLPVIIALASYDHKFFKAPVCGGVFYDKPKGCDGSDLILNRPGFIGINISEVINEIENDYLNLSRKCFEFTESGYSENSNFEAYLNVIMQTEEMSNEQKKIEFPKISLLRNLFFKLHTKFLA